MDILTLFIYDDPKGDIEPNLAAVASIHRQHIVSTVFNIVYNEYLVTLSGQESQGKIYSKWFPETKVNKDTGQVEQVKDKFVKEQTGDFNGRPTAFVIRDKEQIERVWDFMNPGQPCPLFQLREDLEAKFEKEKLEAKQREEELQKQMNSSGLVDVNGSPLSVHNGQLVDAAGDPLSPAKTL